MRKCIQESLNKESAQVGQRDFTEPTIYTNQLPVFNPAVVTAGNDERFVTQFLRSLMRRRVIRLIGDRSSHVSNWKLITVSPHPYP